MKTGTPETPVALDARLRKISELSQRMLAAAGTADWDDLSRLEEQRRQLFHQCRDADGRVQGWSREWLTEILAINHQIVEAGEGVMQALADQLQATGNRRRLGQAYSPGNDE